MFAVRLIVRATIHAADYNLLYDTVAGVEP